MARRRTLVAMAISKNFVIFAYRISLIFHRIDPGPGTGFEHFRSICVCKTLIMPEHFYLIGYLEIICHSSAAIPIPTTVEAERVYYSLTFPGVYVVSQLCLPLSSSLNSPDGGRQIGMMLDTLNFLLWSTVMPRII